MKNETTTEPRRAGPGRPRKYVDAAGLHSRRAKCVYFTPAEGVAIEAALDGREFCEFARRLIFKEIGWPKKPKRQGAMVADIAAVAVSDVTVDAPTITAGGDGDNGNAA